MLHRFPKGVTGEKVHQKRVPGRRAAVARDGAGPLPPLRPARRRAVRDRAGPGDLGRADVDRRVPPVELAAGRHRGARRVAHRPRPDAASAPSTAVRRVADVVHEVLDELGAVGWPKTSGGTGPARLRPHRAGRTGSRDVRRAALAFAREVERRAPADVTTTWWRKDRDPAALFVDYNQNARDHTMAGRLLGAGRARRDRCRHRSRGTRSTTSSPATARWPPCPARFAELGDLHADIDGTPWPIDPLLEWADRDERAGAVDRRPPDDPTGARRTRGGGDGTLHERVARWTWSTGRRV